MRWSSRREAALFWTAVAALAGFFVAMASWTPIQLDDWYEVDWLRHHEFGIATIAEFARYNFVNYNPRIGETLLLVINGPPVVHCIVTPALQLLLPVVLFVLARGAWPRPTRADLAILVVIQALLWLVIPIAGPLYFYRPYTANYLFATCLQLAWFIPFRLELAVARPPRRWLAPIMLLAGVIVGMANEHTGPTAIVAAIAFSAWAWRHGRLRGWMIFGAVGLAIGFAMLVLAPGQSVRYAGIVGNHPFRTLLARGVEGNLRFIGDYALEIAPGLVLVLATGLVALRRGAAMAIDRAAATRIALVIMAALAIVVTAFGSPIVEDRLYFAPCVLTVIALAIAIAVPWGEPRARAILVGASVIVVVLHAIAFTVVFHNLADHTDERLAVLAAARTTDTPALSPQSDWLRDHWQFGEDLQNAYMRELVAHHVYGVSNIVLSPEPSWAQPNPPEVMQLELTYDPPLPTRDALANTPLAAHIPVQWAWVLRELRESWAELTDFAGHELRAIDVRVESPGLPGDRPAHLVTWHGGRFHVIDARTRNDELGWPYAWIDAEHMPLVPTEIFVQACGTTERGTMSRVDREVRIPLRYRCAGNHTVYACDAHDCWLAWRFW